MSWISGYSHSNWKDATWVKGGRVLRGKWHYNWSGSYFLVELNGGERFRVDGDKPEWDRWRLKAGGGEE